MNINLAINEGSKILKSKLIPNPLLDAEILMAKIINKDRNRFLLSILSPISIIIAFLFILPLQNYGYRFQNSTFGIIIILYFYFRTKHK